MGDAERKRAVREWFRVELGSNREEFIRRSGLSKGRATQILTGEEAFGEKAAVNLARSLGFPEDRFLGRAPPAGASLAERYADVLRLWDPLFADQKESLLNTLRVEHQKAVAIIREMTARGLHKHGVPENVLPPEFTRPAQRDLAIGGQEPEKAKPRRKK